MEKSSPVIEEVGKKKRRVVITGIGVISPIGIGKETFWEGIQEGRSGGGRITSFKDSFIPVKIAAEVKDFNPLEYMDRKCVKRTDRASQFAIAASRMAIEDANIDLSNENPQKFGVVIGAGVGGFAFGEDQHLKYLRKGYKTVSPFLAVIMFGGAVSSMVSYELKLKGRSITISTGCTGATDAIGHAFETIQNEDVDLIITGGAEAPIRPAIIASFARMGGVLSTYNDKPEIASRPFDKLRDGMVISEGAGSLILEEIEHALKRNAHIYAEILGYAATDDAYHISTPAPDGIEAIRAITLALQKANVKPEDVDYINAHGTATILNDKTETLVIKKLFGEHAYKLKVSSTKSMLGHSIGAAGAHQLVTCALAMENKFIPPTINYEYEDPECDLDYVPNKGHKGNIDVIVVNTCGFGGKNSALVIRRFKAKD
ncbi:MAG: beta-ketoacyl-ACP synthase II [bacterium]